MFRVSQHPLPGVLKTVTAASGTGHNTGTATPLQRGLIGTGLCKSRLAQNSPYLFTAKLLYMFRVSQHPSSGALKPETAASGTGHNIGTATSLVVCSPDLATLEGSSCVDIMTCTGGCVYGF